MVLHQCFSFIVYLAVFQGFSQGHVLENIIKQCIFNTNTTNTNTNTENPDLDTLESKGHRISKTLWEIQFMVVIRTR